MSGIFGVFSRDGRPVDPAVLERMSNRLAHRGRDRAGVWYDGAVGLGHRMLHTTRESLHERLPIHDEAAQITLTADARIDNRDELRAMLGLRESEAKARTDGELILAAYRKWGHACPEKLVGDFAFAVWDGRRQSMFCARDPMGVRSFFYYQSQRLFVFGTEIKAILCAEGVPRRVNELQVAAFLRAEVEEREMTLYEGIVRLPAASRLEIRREGTRAPERYWNLDAESEILLRDDREYADAFKEVFTEAVHCRTRSAFPVGSALSGGLDSSSIACTARNIMAQDGKRLHTFSAVFPNLPEPERRVADESRWIDSVLASGGFEPHRVEADQLTPMLDLPEQLWHWDEARLSYNMYMHWSLFRVAQESGVRVWLDGTDGDTCVGHGWNRFDALMRAGDWTTFAHEANALCVARGNPLQSSSAVARRYARPYLHELARGLKVWSWWSAARELSTRFGMSMRGLAVRDGLRPLVARRPKNGAEAILRPDFAKRVRAATLPLPAPAKSRKHPRPHGHDHREGLGSPVFQHALETIDGSAAAFGVEPRYPFFDTRLMQFCVSLPLSQKLSNGYSRAILRRAMNGILPEDVQWRPLKQNLSPNFRRGLGQAARDLVQLANEQRHPVGDYVDLGCLRARSEEYLSGGLERRRENSLLLHRVAMLSLWLSDGGWEPPNGRGAIQVVGEPAGGPIRRFTVVPDSHRSGVDAA